MQQPFHPDAPTSARHATGQTSDRHGIVGRPIDRRRLVIGGAGLATLAAARRARAVEGRFTVGLLSSNSPEAVAEQVRRFETRLAELGFAQGRNLVLEHRFARGRAETLPALAEDLLRTRPDVVVAVTNPEIIAVARLTPSIPIVMVVAEDVVGNGLVGSLAHPGGNVTGAQANIANAFGKRLQLLKDIEPGLERVAVLRQRRLQSARQVEGNESAARALRLALDVFELGSIDDLDAAFAGIRASGARALTVEAGTINYMAADRIVAFAREARLPASASTRRFPERGLLMSAGPNLSALYAKAADYVARILRGARPADLPVEQSLQYEVVVNTRVARAIGVRVPAAVLASADAIIE